MTAEEEKRRRNMGLAPRMSSGDRREIDAQRRQKQKETEDRRREEQEVDRKNRLMRVGERVTPEQQKNLEDQAWNAIVQGAIAKADEKPEMPEELGRTLDELRARVAAMEALLNKKPDLQERVFPVINNGDGTFEEVVPAADLSELETVTNGRANDDEDGYAKLLTLSEIDEDAALALEIPFKGGHRYVLISAGSSERSFEGTLGVATVLATRRWNYPFTEVGGMGRTGTATNGIEDPNGASGVQGNGVDVDGLPEGVDLVPLGPGARVRIHIVGAGDDITYRFYAPNSTDGECEDTTGGFG